jgi:signal transduction histidine kinase/CheY-like chemotaxis protein
VKPEAAQTDTAQVSRVDRIQGEQIRSLYRSAVVALNAALVGALVLCGVLYYIGAQTVQALAVWLILVVADYAIRQSLYLVYRRSSPALTDQRRWARRYTAATLFGGLVWGIGAVGLMPDNDSAQLVIMLFIAATASGAVPAFGSHLPTTYAYTVPAMLPFVVWCAGQSDPLHRALVLMGLVFTAVFLALAHRFNGDLIASLALRFENLDLAHDLRHQRDVADAANLAKSRFLAAASHDLRQPVHALGMFVGALRGRAMDAEAMRLVEHVNGSVEALDGLFTAMLDISRLDAGVVPLNRRGFAIQPMLDRVCKDYAAEASAKGVRVVLHRCNVVVYSDPVLIERILRNIVSNAVRYTDRGRVVVGCRRGTALRMEVWDTGRGIPQDQHARVFEEFYQIANPERDRAKGLGLGLAIVKRLASLIECPLTFDSKPGKGSVFRLAVPVFDGEPSTDSMAVDSNSSFALSPPSGLILVIDDEVAIREAMRSLLVEWGHDVIAAGSCAQMLERIATCPTRPALIISDYRLRDEENGIDVIERLRQEFNCDVPAMLITGDTAPDRLQEAQQSGYLLLHKPVPRGRLRAAIGNLAGLGLRDPVE